MATEVKKQERKEGIVKWFSAQKGYGFVSVEGDKDYFVHVDGIKGNEGLPYPEKKGINEGDKVSFIIVKGDKGFRAEEVEVIEEIPQSESEAPAE